MVNINIYSKVAPPANQSFPTNKDNNIDYFRYIVAQSTTPFEKLNPEYEQGQSLDAVSYEYYRSYWLKVLSAQEGEQKLAQFLKFAELSEEDVRQMLAPAKLHKTSVLPEWVAILEGVFANDFRETDAAIDSSNPIPFETLLLPFLHSYRNQLRSASGSAYHQILDITHRKIERVLLQKLSSIVGSVLLQEFHAFIYNTPSDEKKPAQETPVDYRYKLFIENKKQDKLRRFFSDYPMLTRIICQVTLLFSEAIGRFLTRLQKDKKRIQKHFAPLAKIGKVKQLSMDISDLHKGGESVLILEFESNFKLVYKPRCLQISAAYEKFCAWINERLQPQLKTIKVLTGEGYGWIEYIPNAACTTEEEVKNYYERAGILLGITYFLGSTDFHAENIIASGEHPVLLDHETLLQPSFKYNLEKFSPEQQKNLRVANASVLRTNLLPIYDKSIGLRSDIMSGFGSIEGKTQISIAVNQISQVNTDFMKVEKRVVTKDYQSNLPVLNGAVQRISEYAPQLQQGFKKLYGLITSEKDALQSENSPLHLFKTIKLRFLFRSTHIYSTILDNLLKPRYLKDANLYGLRLEFISRAFLKGDEPPNYWLLNETERIQMLNRDIPCYSLDSNSGILNIAEGKQIESYFNLSCIQAIEEKLHQIMGPEDLDFQINTIRESIEGKYNVC